MNRNIQLMYTLFLASAVLSDNLRYCELEGCPNRTHTLCKYPDSRPSERCINVFRLGLSNAEKQIVLQIYNSETPFVRLYELDESSESSQTDINSVVLDYSVIWDDELADIAQRWANQCIDVVDECRNVARFKVEQRAAHQTTLSNHQQPSIRRVLSRWFNEDRLISLSNLNFDNLSLDELQSTASNYYMRLMRQTANHIGCGAVRSYNARLQYLYLVCNFGPV